MFASHAPYLLNDVLVHVGIIRAVYRQGTPETDSTKKRTIS